MSWETKRLGQIADFTLGKMLDQRKNRGTSLPYLANVNVRWGSFDLDDLREMRFEPNEVERYGLRYGDIVMCEGGEPGRCAIWKDELPGMMIQKALHRIRPRNGVDHRFLFYSFLQKGRQGGFSPLFTGSTIKHLPRQNLAKVEVDVPSLDTQRRIASILSAYDDLIENNRRRIQLLEQAARLLYKEWFVHLRFPGHEHVKVKDGVPEGWARRPLGDCAEFLSGGTPSKGRAEFWEGDVPWVSSGELTSMRIHRTTLNITEDAIRAGSRLVPAETILAVVRGMSLAKEFRIGVTARSVAFNQDIKALVSKADIDPLLLYHSIDAQRDAIRDRAGDASHGTKKLETPVLASIAILVPPAVIQTTFRQFVSTFHSQWDVLDGALEKLRAARDLLLPRLMNGGLAV